MELSVRREKNVIEVSCTPAEEAIVMTAWMEVASEMNDLARQISKPIRREDVSRMLSGGENAKSHATGGVGRIVQDFVMIPSFRVATKQEAIEKLVAEIAAKYPDRVSDVSEATAAVLRREASMPTGLDHGIAVPHGRSPFVDGIVGAVAILDNSGTANGCISDYEMIDNSPVSILVLTLANDTAQTPYLQLMSFISKALRANNGYEKLAKCKTADEMRRFFHDVK